MHTHNFFKYFKLAPDLPKLARNLLEQVKHKIRFKALNTIITASCPAPYPAKNLVNLLSFENWKDCRDILQKSKIIFAKGDKIDCKKSKGKIQLFIPKSEDDVHGVTHGSLAGKSQKAYERENLAHFLKKS